MKYRNIRGLHIEELGAKASTRVKDRKGNEIFVDDTMICDSEDGLHLCRVVFEESKSELDLFISGFRLKQLKELDYEDFEEVPYFDVVPEGKY